jgi:carbonic anhydrase
MSLNNLKTFPWIKERYDAGKLFIHGWYFDIESGSLFGNQGDQFVPVKDLVFVS